MGTGGSRFEGKVALVTGGNSGIGRAVAQGLIDEGARVVVVGRNRETVEGTAASLGAAAHGVVADTANVADLDRVIAATRAFGDGRLDVVFANAGIATMGPLASIGERQFDELFGINVKGVFFTVQKAAALLQRGGAIVLNASVVPNRFIGLRSSIAFLICAAASAGSSPRSKIGVSIGPGLTELTRMPRPTSSAPSVRANERTAALLAA